MDRRSWKTYHDFVIKIEPTSDGRFEAEASGPTGEARAVFALPFDEKDLLIFLLQVRQQRHAPGRGRIPEPMQHTVEFGRKLYDTVMSGAVRDVFIAARQAAVQKGCGLRLRLRLQNAPQLADLPWEFLYDGRNFLALSNDLPLVHYLDLPDPPRPLKINLPLRILVTVSSPGDGRLPRLNIEQERANLETALSRLRLAGRVELDFAPNANLKTLQRILRGAQSSGRPYHVWHYIGHGGFSPANQGSVLLFCDEDGAAFPVDGFQLGTLFESYPEMRLALLNSCEGARVNRADPFSGVAAALVECGVPAVIGMQFEISDSAAIAFSEEFYAALADGLPVDAAVTEARRAIFFLPNWVEWATPVLFMRAPNGALFAIHSRRAAGGAAAEAAAKAEAERAAAAKAEQERQAAAQAEAERAAAAKAEQERQAAAQVEAERAAAVKAEQDRQAAAQAEAERAAAAKAEQERQAAAQAEAERAAAVKAEQERQAAAQAEERRLAAAKAEQERLAAQRAAAAQAEQEQLAALQAGAGPAATEARAEPIDLATDAIQEGAEKDEGKRQRAWITFGLLVTLITYIIVLVLLFEYFDAVDSFLSSFQIPAAGGAPEPTPPAKPSAAPLPTDLPYSITSHGMEMLLVPAGEFMMGDDSIVPAAGQQPDTRPAHRVYLSSFYIDKYEVTQAQFAVFLNIKDNQNAGGVPWLNVHLGFVYIYAHINNWSVVDGYSDLPIVGVTWYGAREFCEWRGARLPTEAEWEKAARGRLDGKVYSWGSASPSCNKDAENGAQYGACEREPQPVGSYAANGYGLNDMAGNVWEWVYDWYSWNYYDGSSVVNPQGPLSGNARVVRGGSFHDNATVLQVAFRSRLLPTAPDSTTGFRCAQAP